MTGLLHPRWMRHLEVGWTVFPVLLVQLLVGCNDKAGSLDGALKVMPSAWKSGLVDGQDAREAKCKVNFPFRDVQSKADLGCGICIDKKGTGHFERE